MLAMYGTLLFCAGVLFFFVMLHFHRRPDAARWIKMRAVGEITVFFSMMIVLMGIALVGRFFIQLDTQAFGMQETLVVISALVASYYVIRKSYLPPPDEDIPQLAERGANGTFQPSVTPETAPARKENQVA